MIAFTIIERKPRKTGFLTEAWMPHQRGPMHYAGEFLGYGLRRYSELDSTAVTMLSSHRNGDQAALPAPVRESFRKINPNSGWILELDGRPEAVFEVHLLHQPLAEVIRECPHERDKTARHLLDPHHARDGSTAALLWQEFAAANNIRACMALVASLPFIFRMLRPRRHRNDTVACLLHNHLRQLPMVRRALLLQPTLTVYPHYSDVVHAAPLREILQSLKSQHWMTN